jgi:hypothetical protein
VPVAERLLDELAVVAGAWVQAVSVTIASALTSISRITRVRFNTPERYLAGLKIPASRLRAPS